MKRLLCAALFAATAAHGQVTIDQPWVRATAPGARVGGGYLVIRNAGAAADRLVGASSPAAARVELHVHIREGDIMRMRQVPAFEVPANGSFELKPGGAHLMFMEIRQPFKEGEKLPVILKFEKAGEVSAEFPVGRLGGTAAPMHNMR
jgi:periplasmic copper chaperone A